MIVISLTVSALFCCYFANKILALLGNNLKVNYLDNMVLFPSGIVYVCCLLFFFVVMSFFQFFQSLIIYVMIVLIFGLFGLIDDMFGKESIGFKGHTIMLLKGKMTTGLLKLIFMPLLSFMVLQLATNADILSTLVNAMIVSLSANTTNLFDVRPGRSLKLSITISCLLLIYTLLIRKHELAIYLAISLFVMIWLLVKDLKEICMLGDTGANTIGAYIGITLAMLIDRPLMKIVVVTALFVLNMLSERFSFSIIIEKCRLLKAVDMLGRKSEICIEDKKIEITSEEGE